MRTIILLFLSLITLNLTYEIDSSIKEKIQCLITNEVLYENAMDIYEIIKTKNVKKIIEAILGAYPIIKKEVFKCLKKEVKFFSSLRNLEETKKRRIPSKCEQMCFGSCSHIFKFFEYFECAETCVKDKCKKNIYVFNLD